MYKKTSRKVKSAKSQEPPLKKKQQIHFYPSTTFNSSVMTKTQDLKNKELHQYWKGDLILQDKERTAVEFLTNAGDDLLCSFMLVNYP